MISAEPAARIRALAGLAAADATLARQLRDGPLAAIRAAMESVPGFKTAYLDYLARFGDRCPGELKLESPTLHDDPMALLRSVGRMAGRETPEAGTQMPAGEQPARRAAEARVGKALAAHPFRRVLFAWVLRHTRARVRDRENLRFERTRLFGRVRRLFLELGKRLHAAGRLGDPRDVFLLEVDEVLGMVAGARLEPDAAELVAQRRAEFSCYAATPPPPNRFTTHGPVDRDTAWTDVPPVSPGAEGPVRKGLGCCPGVVRGRVRKIVDPRDATIHEGEILVAERTDPGWILLFPAAAGLLVERGSLLSHSAIVAREMGLPAVVSIDGLMGWLQDGDQVEFDGGTGVVRRVGRPGVDAAGAGPSIPRGGDGFLPIGIPGTQSPTINP